MSSAAVVIGTLRVDNYSVAVKRYIVYMQTE